MLFIEGECPYCCQSRGFNIFSVGPYEASRDVDIIEKMDEIIINEQSGFPVKTYACGTCIKCNGPILIGIEIDDKFLYDLRQSIEYNSKIYRGEKPKIIFTYPEPIPPYSHPSLPQSIIQDFIEIQLILKQKLLPHMVISGCRLILETAVKELGGEGKRLIDRLDDLKRKNILNGVLFDWATQIRLDGNDAINNRIGTQKDAEELVEFTKLFLQYTFEFPARVKNIRTLRHEVKYSDQI